MNPQINTQDGQNTTLNPQALDIVKALAYTENGGAPDISNPSAGKTGEEKSIFQYEPGTWANDSKQVFGKEGIPLTPGTESIVTYSKVNDWLQKGYTAPEIASMWNAGIGEPDAYTGKFSDGTSSVGINKKYGVKYDVPGYVDKFNKYLSSFSTEGGTDVSTPPTMTETSLPTSASASPAIPNKADTTSQAPKKKGMVNATALPKLALKSKGMLS